MKWKARYFANQDYTNLLLERDDGDVLNVHAYLVGNKWYHDPLFFAPVRESNGTSVIWSGKVRASYSELYTFFLWIDNSVQILIDGIQVTNLGNGDGGYGPSSFTKQLEAQRVYDFTVLFRNWPGSVGVNPAIFQMEWSSASQIRQFVPAIELIPFPTLIAAPPALVGNLGWYCINPHTTKGKFTVKEHFGTLLSNEHTVKALDGLYYEPPGNVNNTSARITGFIEFLFDEVFTISVTVNDGVRLWLNGNLKIDEWHNSSGSTYTFTHNASIGEKKLPIIVEYLNTIAVEGYDFIAVRWNSTSQPLEIIPASI